ncbi:hypothetical protein N181_18015 [Sinorhizobium fredii USDA 205]|uniref:Uncharacterized protein n=1 Tax=Rhizobium fredii TaxID=380 RepID=A0A844A6F3_RHIFR|nr:hypothetical protein [Sinorhizobium fredii]KSV87631.1 hypothetical protein N181_18015 [Sinorhizobium fredii USDA 205]MCG5474641.1 hypothetical protein [Sinorhizobium fredii]MQW98635.1 hypothetical protein [Sinorhizobium fredii]MQX07831.1 hypothetical protein [Sinorhizobium fredii]GEC35760.1 hypothetical protein EFR01_59310 [Sinorhizobium fredii]
MPKHNDDIRAGAAEAAEAFWQAQEPANQCLADQIRKGLRKHHVSKDRVR